MIFSAFLGARTMFDAIIDPISDLSTIAAQAAVEWIADHTSLRRDGWVLIGVKFLAACLVFLAIAVVVPTLIIALIVWAAFKFLFS